MPHHPFSFFFFFNDTATTEIYTLSLHDALPISAGPQPRRGGGQMAKKKAFGGYSISFKGCQDSLEKLFGSTPIGPSVMTKKLWSYVKRKRLGKRREPRAPPALGDRESVGEGKRVD